MKIIKIFKETISDGPGFRYSIYFSGCTHYCKGCHNPETWKGDIGDIVTSEYIDEIVEEINSNSLLDGITLSGGDPFFNPEELYNFIGIIKRRTNKDIWCYTGYTFEEILADENKRRSLEYIDTLVDGRFCEDQFKPELFYRGSSNQRIIDVKSSLINNKIIERNYD